MEPHLSRCARSGFIVESSQRVTTRRKLRPTVQNFISPRQLGWDLAGWWPNVKQARGSVKWLNESGAEPLFSLVPPGPRPASCRNNYRVIYFTDEETAQH